MALTLRTNGSSGANLVTASWWNDYYNLLTGSMADQPVTLVPVLTLKGIGGGPGSALTATVVAGTALGIGVYKYVVTFGDGSGGETIAGPSQTATTTTSNQNINLSAIPTGPTGTTKRNLYRTTVGGSTFQFLASINDNTTTTYSDTTADASLGLTQRPLHPSFGGSIFVHDSSGNPMLTVANDGTIYGNVLAQSYGSAPATAPTLTLAAGANLGIGVYKYLVTYLSGKTNINPGETATNATSNTTTTSGNQAVNLTNIPLGPAGTTGRRIYRTAVGGSTYKLLTTISDNTTTTYNDTTADASLGATTPPNHSTFGGSIILQDASGNNNFVMGPDGFIQTSIHWGMNLGGSSQRVLDIKPPDGTKNYALVYFSGNTVGFHNYTDSNDMLVLDNVGNATFGGSITLPGGGSFSISATSIQYQSQQTGAAGGHYFKTWNGTTSVTPFSIGGQLGSALAYVDNAGCFFGLLQTVRNGTKQATTIFTGSTTPTANEVGDIWVNA